MPCLFFRNVPDEVEWDPDAVDALYCEVAEVAGVEPDAVEVHIEDTKYRILRRDGTLDSAHGVHVFVEWHEGRLLVQKCRVAWAIHCFLAWHELAMGSDIAFRDFPAGKTFFYEGMLVASTGELIPVEQLIRKLRGSGPRV